jgi:hypothetical protein
LIRSVIGKRRAIGKHRAIRERRRGHDRKADGRNEACNQSHPFLIADCMESRSAICADYPPAVVVSYKGSAGLPIGGVQGRKRFSSDA